ncbi:MAG: methionine adenosyltransferase [Candidatus Omnitrophota bacterium]|jgi:S-adenosylmethionine synthetase|nr:MAG: methionine adenosyltransferase [Candidatus Omnitrophota bacterium]
MAHERIITSESVTEGHPDKIADQISDGVLDAIYEQDPMGRVACETLITTGLIVIAGEITTNARVDYAQVARSVVNDIGYNNAAYGFDCNTCGVMVTLDRQSPDIAMGVDEKDDHEQGAGDQGMMYGYATNETKEYMPMPILLAHKLTQRLAEVRKTGILPWVRSDGKSQVSVAYEGDEVKRVDAVVISTQHAPDITHKEIYDSILEEVIKKVVPANLLHKETKFHVNPTGKFVVGGPMGDCGLTGRKIIVDTYGGVGRHGGGAFSGKDPSKVDRSAAYAARHAAKNIVAAGLADRCEVSLAYAIGVAQPVSINIETFGTGKIDETKISELVRKHLDMRPASIIKRLNLRQPIFRKTAAYGHFGRDEFPWEQLDCVEALKQG